MNVKWGSLDRPMIVSKRSMLLRTYSASDYCSITALTSGRFNPYTTGLPTSSLDRYQSNIHEDVWYWGYMHVTAVSAAWQMSGVSILSWVGASSIRLGPMPGILVPISLFSKQTVPVLLYCWGFFSLCIPMTRSFLLLVYKMSMMSILCHLPSCSKISIYPPR